MDSIDIIPRLVGGFYAFGGVMGLRAVATDAVLDKALAAISLEKPDPNEALRRRFMGAATVLTGISGLALVLMSGWAAWLFLLNLAFQAFWLVWAGRRFPPQDDEEALGRRRVANAAMVWAVATALVIWLERAGRLATLWEPVAPTVLMVAALGMVAWVAPHLTWKPGPRPAFGEEPGWEPPRRISGRVRLVARCGYVALWDTETGRALNPYDYMSDALADRIIAWEDRFQAVCDLGNPDAPSGFDLLQSRSHEEEGRAIAAELADVFDHVEGPLYDFDPVSKD